MDLQRYVDGIRDQLAVAAGTGGDEARALAERLAAPLDAALRLAFQDVLSAAAEEITCELAPGSVELRLRERSLEFVVTAPPADSAVEDSSEDDLQPTGHSWPEAGAAPPGAPGEADEGVMSRINLRMPDHVKARIEQAASADGLSVNQWLVRAAGAALDRGALDRRRVPRAPRSTQRYTGWAR